jgi:hypothetical protein
VNRQAFIIAAMLLGSVQDLSAAGVSRRATITGGGGGNGNGKCTIEVYVDGAAEVEISGDAGQLRTLSGQEAVWRRFQCNAPLPPMPDDFRFVGVDGRGRVQLRRDPRSNGGRAVVRIDDPHGGREGYTFDLQWRGGGGGRWTPGPPPPPPPGRGPGPGGFPMGRTMQACRDAVTAKLNQSGYSYVTFESTVPSDSPGSHDWVTGSATGRRRFGDTQFSFSCSVDFASGRVRSVDVRRW